MDLLIDAGNTRLKMRTLHVVRGVVTISDLVDSTKLCDLPEIDRVISSKVNNENLKQLTEQLKFKEWIEVSVKPEQFGITCGYETPSNLGIDRWVDILGAELLWPNRNLIVIDSGTATTIDFLTADKKHLGGWILPGPDLMQQSIVDKAPNVFTANKIISEQIGTNTPEALLQGCLAAQQGAVVKAYDVFSNMVNSREIDLVFTGGAANIISQEFALPFKIEPKLLFYGLSRFSR